MTDWIDLCLYCGCAGWDEQEIVPRMSNAVEGSTMVADGGGNASGNGSGTVGLVEPGAGMSSVPDARGEGVGDEDKADLKMEQEQLKLQIQQQQLRPRLFCADCGECFHSWCTTAPVRTMDDKAASAWRCPNCKVRCQPEIYPGILVTQKKLKKSSTTIVCNLFDGVFLYCTGVRG